MLTDSQGEFCGISRIGATGGRRLRAGESKRSVAPARSVPAMPLRAFEAGQQWRQRKGTTRQNRHASRMRISQASLELSDDLGVIGPGEPS